MVFKRLVDLGLPASRLTQVVTPYMAPKRSDQFLLIWDGYSNLQTIEALRFHDGLLLNHEIVCSVQLLQYLRDPGCLSAAVIPLDAVKNEADLAFSELREQGAVLIVDTPRYASLADMISSYHG
jgi:hypothetical protein